MRLFRSTMILAIASIGGLAFGQSVPLKLNLPIGRTYQFSMSNKMSMGGAGSMNAMGNMGQSMSMSIKATGKSAKGTTVQMKVTDVKFNLPPNSPMAAQMATAANSMKGMTIEQLFNPRAQALSSKVIGGNAMSQQMLGQIGATRTGFLGLEFAAGPVSPGAKWSTSVDFSKIVGAAAPGMVKMGSNSKVPIHYTFVGMQSKGATRLAKVTYNMVGAMDMAVGGQGGPNGQAMKMKMNLDIKGTFMVDPTTGIPVSGTSNGVTKTAIQGMNFSQTISTSFTVK